MKKVPFKKILLPTLACVAMSSHVFAAEITVSAAASLTDAFKTMAKAYETKYPQDKILLNFGASGSLLQQIDKGAPVDVFASADQETMNLATQKKLISPNKRTNFIANSLVLITPTSSHLKLTQLSDLKNAQIKHIAIGNPDTVPAGRYAKGALTQAKLWSTLENKMVNTQNVRQALDYVSREEAQAGFVFGSDAYIMKNKVKVAFKVATKTPVTYPIAPINSSKNQKEAQQFIHFVKSADGQKILQQYGFQPLKTK